MANPISDEQSDAFGAVVFNATQSFVAVLVKQAMAGFFARAVVLVGPEPVERYVRGAIGMCLITVGASQIRKSGLTLDDARREIEDAWEDWAVEGRDGPRVSPLASEGGK